MTLNAVESVRTGWWIEKRGSFTHGELSGGKRFAHGMLFSDKDGDGPFARRIALLVWELFLFSDLANVLRFGMSGIGKAVPLHGLR